MASFVGLTPESFQKLDDFMNGGGGGGSYTLPTMSASTKGGAMVGDGLAMTGDALGIGDGGVDMGKLSQEVQEAIAEGGSGSGYNPSLSVGRADALTGADETSQWTQRTSEGSGSATVRSVKGATVAWNSYFGDESSWTATPNVQIADHDGYLTLDFSEVTSGTYVGLYNPTLGPKVQSGHSYLSRAYVRNNTTEKSVCVNGGGSQSAGVGLTLTAAATSGSEWVSMSAIRVAQQGYDSNNLYPSLSALNARSGSLDVKKNLLMVDLTAMFGAGNEPQSVAEFEQMFPEPYYPYSAPTLKPVQIAGIASTDAQGGELDAIEWTAQTLRAAGSVRDELTADELVTRVGVVVIDGVNVKAYGVYPISGVTHALVDMGSGAMYYDASHVVISCDKLPVMSGNQEWVATLGIGVGSDRFIRFVTPEIAEATSADDLNAWLQQNPLTCFYAIATPTTTPISPALPMTYRVQAGGSESIIVPAGEISAIPVLTVAEGESVADVVMDALACIATPDGPVATANHAQNTYLTMGGKLYKVTSAIAVGETIAPNTNVSETTVMAELIARTA